jgi:outer membrane protein assembly factor BamE (lipoprotein component of BamABCDE complex)
MTSVSRNFFWIVALATALLFNTGCAIISHGRMGRIETGVVDALQIGITKREDVVKLLGKPQQVKYKPNKTEIFIYSHGVERSLGIPLIISWIRSSGTGQTLVITFDQYGVVTDYEYTTDEREMIE